MPSLTIESPVGPLTIVETGGAITALGWSGPAGEWLASGDRPGRRLVLFLLLLFLL